MTERRPVPLIAGLLLAAVVPANPAAAADLESARVFALPVEIDAAPGDAGGDQHDDRAADRRDAAEHGESGRHEDDAPHGHGRAPAPASTYEG